MRVSNRPVYLNLWRIKFPLPAIISILHRIAGVVTFLGLPVLLYLLSQSLKSPNSFHHLLKSLSNPGMKCVMWIILSALSGHFFAGVRHLLMDMGFGESLKAGRFSAFIVAAVTATVIVLLGFWLWS